MRRAIEAFRESDRSSGRTDPDHDRALEQALGSRLTVITGGPGTGKTTVVVRIIACLLAENPDLVIAGSAPTGKASSNLEGSILGALPGMESGGAELARLAGLVRSSGIRCQTLQRWLSEQRRIEADVLVVDECSMMDLDLASRLFDALDPARTRVLLLGDKDQLAAVGPGSVFSDLSDKAGPLGPWICEFTKNHRFSGGSRLYRLARAITPKSGEVDEKAVFDVLEAPNQEGDNAIDWKKAPGRTSGGVSRELQAWLKSAYGFLLQQGRKGARFPQARDAEAVDRLWAQVDSVRVLSSVHAGDNGTDAVNAFMERIVRAASAAGPGLTFVTMPAVFAQLPAGGLFAIAFYACLTFAALTSSVSLLELDAAFLVDEHGFSRAGAAGLCSVAVMAVGIFCSLSFGPLADAKFLGKNAFEWCDFLTSNISLPLGGLAVALLAGVFCWPAFRRAVATGSTLTEGWFKLFRVLLTVACPILVIAVLVIGLL